MKKFSTLAIALLTVGMMSAQNAELVVQKVDNNGAVPGSTFRVHVVLPSSTHSLHAVFGDDESSMSIQSTAPFYQHQYGGNTSLDINSSAVEAVAELNYDSWVTIGADNSVSNSLWNVGVDFEGFNGGTALSVEDGAWFLIPTDVYTGGDNNNMVLIAQLTTEGNANGLLNVQGWDGDHQPWQTRGLTFSTKNAQTFGCDDATATNYNAEATYNDGSCEFAAGGSDSNTAETALTSADAEENNWQVFPNPIWEGQFNIQFADKLDLETGKVLVDIFDMSGKKVYSSQISDGDIIGGNKLMIKADLAAGMFNVNITVGEKMDSQQIVVQK